MVLGLRSKNKKSTTIHLDYIIHFQEIKPWPPSQSLRSVRSVVLQWESGDHRKASAGSTAAVTLSPGEGKIEFNEPFRFRTALLRESSGTFQKNVLELNLYEHPRRDRAAKGQHLGTAAVDLAEHGVITEPVSVGVPLSCKRTFRNVPQPVLYLRIQPQDTEGSSSSLSSAGSLSKNCRESVSALMNGEYADEAEIASFTDDDDEDVSAHSSVTRSSSALGDAADLSVRSSPGKDSRDHDENLLQEMETARVEDTDSPSESVLEKLQVEPVAKASMSEVAEVHLSESSSLDLPTDPASADGTDASLSSSPHRVLISEKQETTGLYSSSSEIFKDKVKGSGFNEEKGDSEGTDLLQGTQEKMVDCRGEGYVVDNHLKKEDNINGIIVEAESSDIDLEKEKQDVVIVAVSQSNFDEDVKTLENTNGSDEAASNHAAHNMFVNGNIEHKPIEYGSKEKSGETESRSTGTECLTENTGNHSDKIDGSVVNTSVTGQHEYLQKSSRKPFSSEVNTLSRRGFGERGNGTLASDRADNIFPIRPNLDLNESIRYGNNHQYMEDVKEIDVLGNVRNSSVNAVSDDRLDDQQNPSSSSYKVILASRINRNSFSDNKARELSLKIQRLEGELKEAAAIEISLYSVVAEHGSSTNKVHTPARRLSRLYNHASKQLSREKMASAAKSAVSGLVLAAKACGNDVPRLTFWLSNSVVLRAIVTQPIGHSNIFESVGPSLAANGIGVVSKKKSSPLKWESPRKKEMLCSTEEYDDWEDRNTFITALERIETWIFSRIIESIWWQALAPHMQPSNKCCEPMATSPSKKNLGRKPSLDDQQKSNSSFEIWKKAFKDAYEKLCPVRAGGHECGCLPMLARLVMEQCVARLDVAMFNAILREPDDEIPTDPVSDPISNSKVLPIPSGKLSFGAGAQLKNAIGSWSRWLTDLFGMDADDSPQDENEKDDRLDVAASFKSFHVLNALSDLLMLPKDMLSESSIRKEVCPAFNSAIIKRILSSFMPDEFCPDPIPDMLLEALNSEDHPVGGGEVIRSFPSSASPVTYSPPSISSVEGIIGNVRRASLQRSGSSVVRKCHTSDDELDDLDSPFGSIVLDKSLTPTTKSKGNNGATPVRYRLLREVWRDDE